MTSLMWSWFDLDRGTVANCSVEPYYIVTEEMDVAYVKVIRKRASLLSSPITLDATACMQELAEGKAKSVISWNLRIKIVHWLNHNFSRAKVACVHAPLYWSAKTLP